MEVINLSDTNSILNRFMAEIRDVNIQKDAMRFRRNLERIGEVMAYEMSKRLTYASTHVTTCLGTATVNLPQESIVLATIFRAGLPFHRGFQNYFDNTENAFVSAYRKYIDETNFDVHIEYLASPRLEGKTLVIVDPMLATGSSMELAYRALLTKGVPDKVHIASVIGTPAAVELLRRVFPQANTTLWCAAIDPSLNDHYYIVPGLGDAGDLAFGQKE